MNKDLTSTTLKGRQTSTACFTVKSGEVGVRKRGCSFKHSAFIWVGEDLAVSRLVQLRRPREGSRVDLEHSLYLPPWAN